MGRNEYEYPIASEATVSPRVGTPASAAAMIATGRTIAYTAAVIAAAITVPINASAAIAGRSPPDRGNRTVAAMATAAAAPIVSQPARESVRPRADSV